MTTKRLHFAGAAGLAILLASAAAAAGQASAHPTVQSDAVTDWNANAGRAAIAACISPLDNPLHESRMYAMTHVAIHDALNAINRRSHPYALDTRARRGASPDAAVAAAARDVLVPLLNQIPAPFPPECGAAGVASVEADYKAALAAIPDGRAKFRGLSVGSDAAAAILSLQERRRLRYAAPRLRLPAGHGSRRVSLHTRSAVRVRTRLGRRHPFVLRDASQFRPRPPYAVTSPKYTADFTEVKRLGGDGTTTPSDRTAEQTEIALFWVESSPLQWNRIARSISSSSRLDPWEQARLFGLLNMALADGYVGSFETKYHYNLWRPVTAIRAAGTDGNPGTSPDPTWTPLVVTPPIPDYDSAHSVQGGAASTVLQRFFGTDRVAFETCSLTLAAGKTCTDASPVLRRYTSFSQAAAENGLSRILVGFHFRKAVEEGIEHGRKVGNRAVDRFMRPTNR